MRRLSKQVGKSNLINLAIDYLKDDIVQMFNDYFTDEKTIEVFENEIFDIKKLYDWVYSQLECSGYITKDPDELFKLIIEDHNYCGLSDTYEKQLFNEGVFFDGMSHLFEDSDAPLDNKKIIQGLSYNFEKNILYTEDFLTKIKNILIKNIRNIQLQDDINKNEIKKEIDNLNINDLKFINLEDIIPVNYNNYNYNYMAIVDFIEDEEIPKILKEFITSEMEQAFNKAKYVHNTMNKGIEMKEYEGKLKNRILRRIARMYKN